MAATGTHAAGAPLPYADHALVAAPAAAGAGGAMIAKYVYLFPPPTRWRGPVRWRYNHAGAPAQLADAKEDVVARIRAAFDRWAAGCGVTHVYEGETTVAPNNDASDPERPPAPDGTSVVGWGRLAPALGAWAYAWYAADGADRTLFETDITLSVDLVASLPEVERLMVHEWGHALGLDHSDSEAAVMAGPPSTHYNQLTALQADDTRGCRCAHGLPAGMTAGYACAVPSRIDFGNAGVGLPAPLQRVPFGNSGNVPLAIDAVRVEGAQFRHVEGCLPGEAVPPGATCTLTLEATAAEPGPVAARLTLDTSDGRYEAALSVTGVTAEQPVAGGPVVEVVEYYNTVLDHYFMTWLPEEIAYLDAGATPTRWTRTGQTFKAYATPQPGTSAVCRFYLPPEAGSSHFFGRDAAECAATRDAHPAFILEAPVYMAMFVPAAGACPANTRPLYRVFNHRADANHRYVVDRALRDAMAAAGWIAEGDGPDLVAACAPAG